MHQALEKTKIYFKTAFLSDLKAGSITAVVALPLAIAFAIASGVEPIMGIYTAVIAGVLASLTGGSAFSITGPTGAMAVIILSTVNEHGIEGLLLAGFLAGLMQYILGKIKLGRLVKFIPFPIVSGFTAGIGALILLGQVPNALGIAIASQEHIWQTIALIAKNLSGAHLIALSITASTILIMAFLPRISSRARFLKNIPPSMIALVLATGAVYLFKLSIPTVGAIPAALPKIQPYVIDFELVKNVLPAAFTIALLGAIEALLCAVVCDGMTNTKHKSNKELRSQGVVNMILPFFGAIPATAAIARSAVNIREGAKTRLAGAYHAVILGIIVFFFGSVAQYIPTSFLAGVLIYVSYRMINVNEFKTISRISQKEFIVLIITFGLTIFTDLVFAVQVGLMLAIGLLFIRLSKLLDIKSMSKHDPKNELPKLLNGDKKLKKNLSIYTINGPFFFGAMNTFDNKLGEQIDIKKDHLILRMKHVPFIDSSACERLKQFIRQRNKEGRMVYLTTLNQSVKETLLKDEEFKKLLKKNKTFETTEKAVDHVRRKVHQQAG